MDTYHPSKLKPETIKRDIESRSRHYLTTKGEEIVIQSLAIDMILRGNPPATLKTNCERRGRQMLADLAELSEEGALEIAGEMFRAIPLALSLRL